MRDCTSKTAELTTSRKLYTNLLAKCPAHRALLSRLGPDVLPSDNSSLLPTVSGGVGQRRAVIRVRTQLSDGTPCVAADTVRSVRHLERGDCQSGLSHTRGAE